MNDWVRRIREALCSEDIAEALHDRCVTYKARTGAIEPWYDDRPWDDITEAHRQSHREDVAYFKGVLDRIRAILEGADSLSERPQ